MTSYQVRFIHWWNRPVKLFKKTDQGFERIGWVWNQRAYIVNNLHEGWIAFVEDQTADNLDVWFCPHCRASLWGTVRQRILDASKKVDEAQK